MTTLPSRDALIKNPEHELQEPKYPGDAVRERTLCLGDNIDIELGTIRIMDYGCQRWCRYRVASFCTGRFICLPGDSPKIEPEHERWCETPEDANYWFDLYLSQRHAEGWKDLDTR